MKSSTQNPNWNSALIIVVQRAKGQNWHVVKHFKTTEYTHESMTAEITRNRNYRNTILHETQLHKISKRLEREESRESGENKNWINSN